MSADRFNLKREMDKLKISKREKAIRELHEDGSLSEDWCDDCQYLLKVIDKLRRP